MTNSFFLIWLESGHVDDNNKVVLGYNNSLKFFKSGIMFSNSNYVFFLSNNIE